MDQTSKITNRISIYFRARIPVLLWGPPGVGKTAYLEHFAKKVGRRLIVPTVRAPEDIAVPVTLPDGSGVEVLPVSQFIEAVKFVKDFADYVKTQVAVHPEYFYQDLIVDSSKRMVCKLSFGWCTYMGALIDVGLTRWLPSGHLQRDKVMFAPRGN